MKKTLENNIFPKYHDHDTLMIINYDMYYLF
jgi:hypothetical protein